MRTKFTHYFIVLICVLCLGFLILLELQIAEAVSRDSQIDIYDVVLLLLIPVPTLMFVAAFFRKDPRSKAVSLILRKLDLDQSGIMKVGVEAVAKLSENERHFIMLEQFVITAQAGNIESYIMSTAGDNLPELRSLFNEWGFQKYERTSRELIEKLFSGDYPKSSEERIEAINTFFPEREERLLAFSGVTHTYSERYAFQNRVNRKLDELAEKVLGHKTN